MKRRFQIYLSCVENIKDNHEKQLESGLKCLNKCHFYTLANNHTWRMNTLEYEIDSKIMDSLRDKEHDDAQFLQIGVSMAKLQPLLNHCKFFMKCVFVLSFYNALYCRFLYAPLCRVFANRVTFLLHAELKIHYVNKECTAGFWTK